MEKMTLLWLFEKGGWSMWPLLVMSIITIAVTVERLIFFVMHNLNVKDVEMKVIEMIRAGDLKGAEEYLDGFKKNKKAVGIIKEGLRMAKLGEHRIEKAFESETQQQVKELDKGLNFLVEMGSLAPITGFLGTVSGMISAFGAIAKATDVNAQLVAGGIFEALITTAYGLIIAVVAIAMYNFYTGIVEKFIADMERVGSDVVTEIILSGQAGSSQDK